MADKNRYGQTSGASNFIDALVVRLDGSLAVAATPNVNFTGGTPGNTYTLNYPFRSMACAWVKTTVDAAIFKINDVEYSAGSAGAGYSAVLPQLTNDGGSELHDFPLVFEAQTGAAVEIIITRDA